MIEVTDEMLQTLKDYCKFYISDVDAIERIIELHEQSKPTRKPLTTDEIKLIATYGSGRLTDDDAFMVARAVERAHGIHKNITN